MINIYNQDCMEAMREMADNQFDLAIVDPPYRDKNNPTNQMRDKLGGNMQNFGFKPTKEFFVQLFRISKNQIIWGANNFIEHLYSTNCFLFWYKRNPWPTYSDGELAWTSFNSVAKCIPIDHFGNNTKDKIKFHPTQKPVMLYEWLLINYAKEGDKILDTHLGSGSIAIACHNLGFDLTGYEIDKEYFEAANKRIEEHKQQKRLFI